MAKNYGTENKTSDVYKRQNEMNTRNAQDCGKNCGKNSAKSSSKSKMTNAYDSEQDDYSSRY